MNDEKMIFLFRFGFFFSNKIDRRSARRILEEHLGQPLLGRFEEVFRRYTVSVDVHGRKFFGTGHTFTAARNDAAENALKTIGQRWSSHRFEYWFFFVFFFFFYRISVSLASR